jgi:hypothetical protein
LTSALPSRTIASQAAAKVSPLASALDPPPEANRPFERLLLILIVSVIIKIVVRDLDKDLRTAFVLRLTAARDFARRQPAQRRALFFLPLPVRLH